MGPADPRGASQEDKISASTNCARYSSIIQRVPPTPKVSNSWITGLHTVNKTVGGYATNTE